jgi:hypothetical protein
MMFYASRDRVAKVIHQLQHKACCYRGPRDKPEPFDIAHPHHCDCKYVEGEDYTKLLSGHEGGNGCCELRCAAVVLQTMTEAEWKRIWERATKKQKKSRPTNTEKVLIYFAEAIQAAVPTKKKSRGNQHRGFPVGAKVFVDGKDKAVVKQYFPEGSSSFLFPHYKLDYVDGDKNVAVNSKRVSVNPL